MRASSVLTLTLCAPLLVASSALGLQGSRLLLMAAPPVYTATTRFRVTDVFAPATSQNDFPVTATSTQGPLGSSMLALPQQPSSAPLPGSNRRLLTEDALERQAAEVRQAFAAYEAREGAKPRASTHARPPTGSPGHMPIPRASAPSAPATQHPPVPAPVPAPVSPAPREAAAVAPVAGHSTHTAPLSAPSMPESKAAATVPASSSGTMPEAPIAAQSAHP